MLKQNSSYADEAQKLSYLYDYMIRWAEGTDQELKLRKQIIDYVLSVAIIRSGGRLPQDDFSTFDTVYYGKKVVVYSAGTFGQQLINRFKETGHCRVVAWLDDDYWEYRRCCLDVDPVKSIVSLTYDYILVATVDFVMAEKIGKKLLDLGVSKERILTVTVPEDREQLVNRFLDVESIRAEELKQKGKVLSHA